jgi:hypothetical protein
MNIRTVFFLVILFLVIGLVVGYSIHKQPAVNNQPAVTTLIIHDTIIKVPSDSIKIPINGVKRFKKTKKEIITIAANSITPDKTHDTIITSSVNCVTFPLLLSDSSVIAVTECSKETIPGDLTFEAKYIDKRERIRIVEKTRVDTVQLKPKRLGFTLGPSAGVGIDINNLRQPAYFVGITLTYGLRF